MNVSDINKVSPPFGDQFLLQITESSPLYILRSMLLFSFKHFHVVGFCYFLFRFSFTTHWIMDALWWQTFWLLKESRALLLIFSLPDTHKFIFCVSVKIWFYSWSVHKYDRQRQNYSWTHGAVAVDSTQCRLIPGLTTQNADQLLHSLPSEHIHVWLVSLSLYNHYQWQS